ncbi:MAG TPA: aa3-type cytochrome c oxidase subunit IV [Alphaproteobacteria bacterium]|nr:aa3-type cytochrome c oxidase subunit IV [Alphaproteobacteria bacterium]
MEDFEQSVRRHERSWKGFVDLMFWSGLGVVVLLVLMAIFLL